MTREKIIGERDLNHREGGRVTSETKKLEKKWGIATTETRHASRDERKRLQIRPSSPFKKELTNVRALGGRILSSAGWLVKRRLSAVYVGEVKWG